MNQVIQGGNGLDESIFSDDMNDDLDAKLNNMGSVLSSEQT